MMRNERPVVLLALALAVIGAGAACSALGATTLTPAFSEIIPVGTEQPPATSAPSEPATTEQAGDSPTIADILAFYPLAKGAAWTYQVTVDMSTGPGPDVTHWEGPITQTVTAESTENGFPVFQLDWSGYPDFLAPQFGTRYEVVREAGIYEAWSPDQVTRLATSEVFTQIAYLAWPLENGKVWGDPDMIALNNGFYVWRLEDAGSLRVPAGTLDGCYKATMMTNPDTTIRWFCPGKGLARFEYHHHGTIIDQVWELASFTPGE